MDWDLRDRRRGSTSEPELYSSLQELMVSVPDALCDILFRLARGLPIFRRLLSSRRLVECKRGDGVGETERLRCMRSRS